MHPYQVILAGLQPKEEKMSEFEARCGCLLSSHEIKRGKCPVHDEPIIKMDGKTDRQLRMEEWEFDTRERIEEEVQDD